MVKLEELTKYFQKVKTTLLNYFHKVKILYLTTFTKSTLLNYFHKVKITLLNYFYKVKITLLNYFHKVKTTSQKEHVASTSLMILSKSLKAVCAVLPGDVCMIWTLAVADSRILLFSSRISWLDLALKETISREKGWHLFILCYNQKVSDAPCLSGYMLSKDHIFNPIIPHDQDVTLSSDLQVSETGNQFVNVKISSGTQP